MTFTVMIKVILPKSENASTIILHQNDIPIAIEVVDAMEKIKCGKAVGLDDVGVERIIKSSKVVNEWLVRLCNVRYQARKITKACISTNYKGKEHKTKLMNFKGISLLSIPD